ncbi:hypothetical protein [Pedobacter montanisoli]|uniref:DUF541 domain-containing protein n=1 Tax=Pedobacter montanisoli TaxID=2923277 RepID=A0ABS9ZXB4_9SPHI|nr:hypothetical protein [Pedobacter montanisoli]MCJ0742953.1 hypothetical protein [Pedobacter montanisoli]
MMMKRMLFTTMTLAAIMVLLAKFTFAQSSNTEKTPDDRYSYAYISVEGKALSKKLKVQVDLGDTPEQIEKGKTYSEHLTNKKSYAAVLNYMIENQFELVNTLGLNSSYKGTGETSGIIFIMKKKSSYHENKGR